MERQMGNHDSRIEDNHRDLHELMGTVENIKEDVQKLINMNQCSHCQDSPAKDHPMEKNSVMKHIYEPSDKKKK